MRPRTACKRDSESILADVQKEIAHAKGKTMALVTIKAFEDELSHSPTKDLMHKLTEAVIPFVGEKLRDNTWVLIEEIASGS
jgi:phenylpyruvate tautomerase PptA (4-oxalocrotonate tautomerase family)